MVARLVNPSDSKQLLACEEVIERGLDSFIEVGNALLQIRDAKLYRHDYEDFDSYCRERWDMSGAHAHRLVDSAKVMQNLATHQIGELPAPRKESVVRPLVALPAPLQAGAWTEAVTTAKRPGKPTAKEVTAAVIKALPEVRTKTVTVRTDGTIKNSPVLRELKRSWKQAAAPEREAFRNWIGEHP